MTLAGLDVHALDGLEAAVFPGLQALLRLALRLPIGRTIVVHTPCAPQYARMNSVPEHG